MADTDINAEGKLLSDIGELVLEADINKDSENVAIEEFDLDKSEKQKIRDFMDTGCGCTVNKGKPCFNQFSETHYSSIVLCVNKGKPSFNQFSETHYSTMRNNCAELDHNSLDIVIISQIMASTNISEFLEIRERKQQRKNYILSSLKKGK